jgi:hypothetical protein
MDKKPNTAETPATSLPSPKWSSTTIAALTSIAIVLLLISGMTLYWLAASTAKAKEPALTATSTPHTVKFVFPSIQQAVPGLIESRSISVFWPHPADQSAAFTDKAGEWFLLAIFSSKEYATEDEALMSQGAYMVLQRNDCILIMDVGNTNSDVVMAFDKACS